MNVTSILVVDDEPDNFDVIETLLSIDRENLELNRECELYYADSGQEAIESLDTYNPDLILLDVMMPGIDGIEVCRQIKAMPKWQAVPIIMVTALNSKSDLARCLSAGADDFISKPINALEFRARVNSMLRIKQQYDNLQNFLKLREDMVKTIVHDLRTPLSSIMLGVQLLKIEEHPREKKEPIDYIYYSAQRLQRLIDDILQISLIESGKVRLRLTDIDICDFIKSAISNFEAIAAQKNQTIVEQLPEEPSRKFSMDASMMHRTLDNLLSNAMKFSPRDSQILVNLEFLQSGNAKIQVIDSGLGVTEALQQKIFEKYEIGTMMSEISQIGLGLAFCKMVVEAHGGEIGVKSNQPKGAIFEITLAA